MLRGDEFNTSILATVEALYAKWGGQGYDINSVFAHNLQYGPDCRVLANHDSRTTCAWRARTEAIITALTDWYAKTGNRKPFETIPIKSWRGGTKRDIRPHVFMYDGLDPNGTAHALERFGIGRQVAFSELAPGGFINFNRTRPSGHACVFLSYIDRAGNDVATYGVDVAGFRYGWSQGGGPPEGGFGFRWAFFGDHCPVLPPGRKRDCGVIRSDKPTFLCCGHMLAPEHWPLGPEFEKRITSRIGRETDDGVAGDDLAKELEREPPLPDLSRFDGVTTD